MFKPFVLASLYALPLALFAPAAQAQMARDCDGKLSAHAFYSTVQSNGSRSIVSYFMQLQNQSAHPLRYTVRFTAPHVTEAQNGSVIASLAAYQAQNLLLGKQNFNNPAGTGQLSPANLIRYTQVICPR